jgi:hypothetical protein
MKTALSIAVALVLYAPSARAEDSSLDARRAVREALAERALGPVSPPVLPVLLPGLPGEPGRRREMQPRPAPAPSSQPHGPAKPAAPAPGSRPSERGSQAPAHHAGPGGAMAQSAQSEAVGLGARDAHRIRADAANRAAAGAAANGASSAFPHADSDCHDAASTMRTMGMDPEHTGDPHHGGMMPDGGSMPGGHH